MTTGPDKCFRCGSALQIVRVTFSLTGAHLVTLCPSCANAKADGSADVEADPPTQHVDRSLDVHTLSV